MATLLTTMPNNLQCGPLQVAAGLMVLLQCRHCLFYLPARIYLFYSREKEITIID